jgi:hypothetical protein
VINPLYHRSYEEREPIEARINPDDLIVLSYPGPDQTGPCAWSSFVPAGQYRGGTATGASENSSRSWS